AQDGVEVDGCRVDLEVGASDHASNGSLQTVDNRRAIGDRRSGENLVEDAHVLGGGRGVQRGVVTVPNSRGLQLEDRVHGVLDVLGLQAGVLTLLAGDVDVEQRQ